MSRDGEARADRSGGVVRVAVVLAMALSFMVPATAEASHSCGSRVIVFSGRVEARQEIGFVNTNAPVCGLSGGAAEGTFDGRIINPGSNRIAVRFARDLGDAVPVVLVELRGLGFDGEIVEASRSTNIVSDVNRLLTGTQSFVYQTDHLEIDPAASGAVTARVFVPGSTEPLDSTTFRTVDA